MVFTLHCKDCGQTWEAVALTTVTSTMVEQTMKYHRGEARYLFFSLGPCPPCEREPELLEHPRTG